MTADSFATYAADRPDARFTDWLRERSEPDWTAATEHRFPRELVAGTIDDAVFRRYLIQDHAFVGTLTSAVGYAVGQAPTIDAKRSLTRFLGTLTDEENDYFERSFDALDVPPDGRRDPELADVTQAFEDLLIRAAREGGYAETLAALVPAEWVYLTWASAATETPEAFYLREWIDLHANPEFESFVDWLRDELDTIGPALEKRRQRQVERLFKRAVALEVVFFDMAYD
jgi:thiaminase/transcriptional activator TenA